MSENVITETANKKKFSIATLFVALVPMLMAWTLMTFAQIPFCLKVVFDVVFDAVKSSTNGAINPDEMINGITSACAMGLIPYAIIALIVFGFWYHYEFVKKGEGKIFSGLSGISITTAAMVAIGTYAIIDLLLVVIGILSPDTMQSYSDLMESSQVFSNVYVNIIYAIVLGPIVEEIAFRGLTFGYLKRAGLSVPLAIVLQAVIFGIFHMNLVQGLYAIILGLAVGYVRYKFNSLALGIFLHIMFNALGSYSQDLLDNVSEFIQTIILIAFGLIGVAGLIIIMVKTGKKRVTEPVE